MDKYLNLLKNISLFQNIKPNEISTLLTCAGVWLKQYSKDSRIISEQEYVRYVGVVLYGTAQASTVDFSGRLFVLERLSEGSVFGEILSISTKQKSPVSVTSLSDCSVLHIPSRFMLNRCRKECAFHEQLSQNLLNLISEKFFALHDRINCVTKPTLREKLLHCLNSEAKRQGTNMFSLPYGRETLAEYVNAERSAVSRELSAMKKAGIIDYYKNTFKLL